MKRLLATLGIIITLGFPYSVFAATIDTFSGTPANSTRIGDVSGRTYEAQQFLTTAAGTIDSLKFWQRSVTGSPTDGVVVEIWTDSGSDEPASLISGATETITAGSIVDGANSYDISESTTVNFSSPATVSDATLYWVVMYRSGSIDGSNYRNMWTNDSGNVYTEGIHLTGDSTPTWTQVATNRDQWYQIEITEAATETAVYGEALLFGW